MAKCWVCQTDYYAGGNYDPPEPCSCGENYRGSPAGDIPRERIRLTWLHYRWKLAHWVWSLAEWLTPETAD